VGSGQWAVVQVKEIMRLRLCLVSEKFLEKISHWMFRAMLEGFSNINKKI
jgi:hypothetical protein